jgi:simple sugar transport system ATP-binding protein
VHKRFGSTRALDGASLTVSRGTVHALLGENGAGKTTLMRIAFGMLSPDGGTVEIDGIPVRLTETSKAIARGLWMVHQHFTLVPPMSAAENVALGLAGLRYDRRRAVARVREIGQHTGLHVDPHVRVDALPVGAQQRLEVIKAFAHGARTIILDEPTAVLAPTEATELMQVLRHFADSGGTVVLITHKIREALGIADHVTVLREGRTVLSAPRGEITERTLATAMVGELPDSPMVLVSAPGDLVLRARDLVVLDDRNVPRVRGVSLEVREREILGVIGVEGAGHRELLRAIAGRLDLSEGAIERPDDPGFIPEDRQREALLLDFDLAENVALRGAGARRGRIDWSRLRRHTAALLERYDVRAPSMALPAAALSGGNQQKLVLARELADAPRLLIIENPTRGLDVGAAAAVHDQIRDASRAGAAVLVYSSDLDEVLSLADRVLVMFDGHARELPRERDAIGRAMLGLPT